SGGAFWRPAEVIRNGGVDYCRVRPEVTVPDLSHALDQFRCPTGELGGRRHGRHLRSNQSRALLWRVLPQRMHSCIIIPSRRSIHLWMHSGGIFGSATWATPLIDSTSRMPQCLQTCTVRPLSPSA